MTPKSPAPKPPPPPPGKLVSSPQATAPRRLTPRSGVPEIVQLELTSGVIEGSDRIVVYGTGGIGKTTLCNALPEPLFLDIERSTKKMNVKRRDIVTDFWELRGKLAGIAQSPVPGVRSYIIDSGTMVQELAKEFVIEHRQTDKGRSVQRLEEFGWGSGWNYVFEEFTAILSDLDRIADQGFNVALTAHDTTSIVPNPAGEDYIRWEPLLYRGDRNGKGDIRSLLKNWAEHLIFVGYDVFSTKDGKATGSGTRTIYTHEMPTHMAKSRLPGVMMPFELQDPGALWRELGIQ